MSWHFSRALVEEFSEGISLDGELCARLSQIPFVVVCSCKDKMIECYHHSPFGMTCVPSTGILGEEVLTWFRAAFPAEYADWRAVRGGNRR